MEIIAYAIDRETGIYTSDGRHQAEAPYLEFLLNDSGDNVIQCLTQLDYDVAGLLPLLELTPKELEHLQESERLFITPYTIKYYQGRYFRIDKGFGAGHPYSELSDISQYESELNKVLDRHDADYWFKRVRLAHKVATEVFGILTEVTGKEPVNLISPKNAYQHRLSELHLPTVKDLPDRVCALAYDGCMGNWVEAYQRGHFAHATDLDITSAYPNWASRLLDLNYGKWKPNTEYQPDAYYGVALCEVMIDSQFSPIMWKSPDSENYTPKGVFERVLNKQQIRYINECELGWATIVEGYWWRPFKKVKPLEAEIKRLYDLKQVSTGRKRDIIKRIMTGAFYGSFIQVNGKDEDAVFGKFACPPYALEIEANTQIQVANFIRKHQLIDRLLKVTVDGVLISGDIDLPDGNGLGTWRKEYVGEAVVVNSALDCIEGKTGEGEFSINLEKLKELVNADLMTDEWKVEKQAILTLGAARSESHISDVGKIITANMILTLTDVKREYDKIPKTGKDLLTKSYRGEAWDLGLLKSFIDLDDEEESDDD